MVSIADFEQPFYGLKRQGSDANPKVIPLVVIAWEGKGKGEPPLSSSELERLFFGATNSVTHWFQENSQGRYRLVPHPIHPVIGPFQSIYDWPFYWRNGPEYVRRLLCGDPNLFCDAWKQNPYKVPPPNDDPHRYVNQDGSILYLDDEGYLGGHTHSWAEAIRGAAEEIDFRDFDQDRNGNLSVDECLVIIVKAQASTFGTRRPVTGSDVPKTDLVVDGVSIREICELYAAPPHDSDDLAVAIEEVCHLAANMADQYPDKHFRPNNDPRRPGQLALTDARRRPVHVDPYHKLKWGWLNPQLANQSGKYTLRDTATTGDALILYNPSHGLNEFFILENRWRGNSYDRFREDMMQEGLALWHCIEDPELSHDWARRAVHLKRADPRLDDNGQIQWHLTLFDGSDPKRSYTLDDNSYPQNLRFRNGVPSCLRITNFSPAGSVMTVHIELDLNQSSPPLPSVLIPDELMSFILE